MLATGSSVLFFYPRDHLIIDPLRAAMVNKLDLIKTKGVTVDSYFEKMLNSLQAYPNFKVFQEQKVLRSLGCGELTCFNGHTPANLPLYSDTNHLTDFGANLVFNYVQQVIATRVRGN